MLQLSNFQKTIDVLAKVRLEFIDFLNRIFRQHRNLFFNYATRTEFLKADFIKFDLNPEKLIFYYSKEYPASDWVIKMVHPRYLEDHPDERNYLEKCNLSRVYMAAEIRKYSLKYVTTPRKMVFYCDVFKQWVVLSQRLKDFDIRDTEEKLRSLDKKTLG